MPVRAFIKQHPVLTYYVLAFAISWTGILIAVGPAGFLSTTGSSPGFVLVGFASLLGPSVAGLLLTGVLDGRAGFRDLLARLRRWRIGARWYAVALLTAPLVNAATLFALSLTSGEYLPGIFTSDDTLALLLLAAVGGLTVPILEELGWTGFATPRLLARRGVLATGLIMGVLWGAWHLPLFAGNAATSGAVPPVLFMIALLFAWLVPYRILMVWVYDRTQSLLVAMLMHMPIVVGMYVFGSEAISPEGMFTSVVAYGAALWAVVGAVTLANGGRLTQPSVSQALASDGRNGALVPPPRSGRSADKWGFSMGAMIGIGAAIGVLFMPTFGPLGLAVGAALGVVFGAAFEARRSTG